MFAVCVTIHVLPEHADAFLAATRQNADATRDEPKNVRFDVLRGIEDTSRFFLYEIYTDESGFRDHQQTPHYLVWKEAVAPWMAQPRVAIKHAVVSPEPWV